MFRAVVFLSVPFFKGTLALMALPYVALGVRARARYCTVPAEVELQQGAGLRQDLAGSSRMAPQVNIRQTYAMMTGCLLMTDKLKDSCQSSGQSMGLK